jgi:UDP-glucose 4-epimerase
MGKGSRVLVVGGAGYIGTHACLSLKERGYEVSILDNFSTGNRDLAERLQIPIYEADAGSYSDVKKILIETKAQLVMHFAAFASVPESVRDPQKYYQNNVLATLELLRAMRDVNIDKFIFSSTCATFGVPEQMPISEVTTQNPINPYGMSKLMVEQILKDYEVAYGLRSIVFRYFNAAGASSSGLIGERHSPETHIIPLAIGSVLGKNKLHVCGNDYPTPDGTCIRDYLHVDDIANAHILGAEALFDGASTDFYNLGSGVGYSVDEVVKMVSKVSGKDVPFEYSERRLGDPPSLYSDPKKAKSQLGWEPMYPELEDICRTAWDWHVRDNKS